jgi:hypothetical protein
MNLDIGADRTKNVIDTAVIVTPGKPISHPCGGSAIIRHEDEKSATQNENLICRRVCQGVGESRPGWERGGFRLAAMVLTMAVVARDGGVRLICAG